MAAKKILIVEDDVFVAEGLKKKAEKYSYQVCSMARSGEEAINMVREIKPDIILMDIRLEGNLDGIETVARIHGFLDIPVIYISAFSDSDILKRAKLTQPFGYLIKPVSERELHVNIEMAIYKHSMEEKLKQSRVQLFQTAKLATLGEMAAGLSHEINQPLSAISLVTKSFCKLKARGLLTDKELESGLSDIKSSVNRASMIISHMKTFARQDTDPSFTNLNVNDVIEDSLRLIGRQLAQHDIDVIKEFSDSIPKIYGEPYQLEQVIINLLTNARDALNKRKSQEAAGYLKKLVLKTVQVKNEVCVNIFDNGIGMSEETLKKIFVPFFTTKEVGEGTGLGLSISHGIISSFKGRIEVESKAGNNTDINIFLPAVSISKPANNLLAK